MVDSGQSVAPAVGRDSGGDSASTRPMSAADSPRNIQNTTRQACGSANSPPSSGPSSEPTPQMPATMPIIRFHQRSSNHW